MRKKIGLFFGLLLGFCAVGGMCAVSMHSSINNNYVAVCAEGEESSEEPENSSEIPAEDPAEPEEIFECKVILNILAHGKVTADKMEGHVGDIVTITADADMFYIIDYAECNGSALIEDEETTGVYKFALVEGENRVTVRFVVNQELLGELSVMYEQAANKDWTNLFSAENVFRIISLLFSGGLLLAMVRYFIKDKKLAHTVTSTVKKTVNEVVPETTKQVVTENMKDVIEPIFAKTAGYQQEIIRVLGILVKCIALMQEDTPESRRAVLAELANLNIGDMKVIEDAKNFIDAYFAEKAQELNNILGGLDKIIDKNTEIVNKVGIIAEQKPSVEEAEKADAVEPKYDGTQI